MAFHTSPSFCWSVSRQKHSNSLIYLDLAKAFDSVDHRLRKLQSYGVAERLLYWFRDYLSPISTWRICSREQKKKSKRFLLVRGEFFRQPMLTNHVAEFLFSLRVARTKRYSTLFDMQTTELVESHCIINF